jgi:hypothetical protein
MEGTFFGKILEKARRVQQKATNYLYNNETVNKAYEKITGEPLMLSPVPKGTSITQPVPQPKETPTPMPTATSTSAPTPTPVERADYRTWVPEIPYEEAVLTAWGSLTPQAKQVLKWQDENGAYHGENQSFDANVENMNNNGTRDRGLFQINEGSFNDFMRRRKTKLEAAGIKSFDDMFNPLLNARMAKIIYDEQGWDAWYGAPSWLRSM